MSAAPLSADELGAVTTVLKAMAHDVRLALLHALLHHGETSVSDLESLTGIGQPGLSQQLAVLRRAELVETKRQAKLIFYRIAPESLAATAQLLGALANAGKAAPDAAAPAQARPRTGSAATFAQIL